MVQKGDIITINHNCHCPSWIGQKRTVTMVLAAQKCAFAAKMSGTDEHLFRFDEMDTKK